MSDEFGVNLTSVVLEETFIPYEENKYLPEVRGTTSGLFDREKVLKKLNSLESTIGQLQNASTYGLTKEDKEKYAEKILLHIGDLENSGLSLLTDSNKLDAKKIARFSDDEFDPIHSGLENKRQELESSVRKLLTELQSNTTDYQNVVDVLKQILKESREIQKILDNMVRSNH